MYGNGPWNLPLVPAVLVLLEVVIMPFWLQEFQLLTVSASLRLTATAVVVLGHHFTSSTKVTFGDFGDGVKSHLNLQQTKTMKNVNTNLAKNLEKC